MNFGKFFKPIKVTVICGILMGTFASCMKEVNPDEQRKSLQISLIPYIIKQDKHTDLYVIDLNTREKVRLTDDAYEESDPVMLPNGKVLFASKRTGTWQLYVINLDGKGLKPITSDKGVNNYRPSVAIDGSIIFVSDREQSPKIFSIDPDGSNAVKLSDDDNYYDYPAPLDDGTILYLSNALNKWEIWKMNADGSNKKEISTFSFNPLSLSAMPGYVKDYLITTPGLDDSFLSQRNQALYNFTSKAVFTARNKNGDLEIFRINVDGSGLRNLTEMPGIDANPVVLKNGKIIFTSDRDGNFDVWMMEPDGFNPSNITKEPYYASTR